MSVTIPSSRILPVNSTSYVDMLAVQTGLERLPGESAAAFLERIEQSLSASAGPEYSGLIHTLNVALGLEMRPAIQIETAQAVDIRVSFGRLQVGDQQVALLSFTSDDFWQWRTLADTAAELNRLSGVTATLAGDDGPALELVWQANSGLVWNETLSGEQTAYLAHAGVLADSISFNQATPGFVAGPDGRSLHFSGSVADGTTVTYRYRQSPYTLVASPIAVFSLTDPQVQIQARGSNGRVIHQVREYIQEILRRDASYWAS